MSHKRRKVVLVIVEGPSDQTALEQSLSLLFDPEEVMFQIIFGDITSDYDVDSTNVATAVYKEVKSFASRYGLKKKDFIRIIHIADTDGAFIPDANVIENDQSPAKPIYTLSDIRANPQSKIKDRNRRKRGNLNKLSSLNVIWASIPYAIYYMSCNLDHVLYNLQNSDDDTKAKNSIEFAMRYKDDLEGFRTFISDPTFADPGDYKASWEFIRNGLNSLQRHTNLNLCFEAESQG